MTEIVKKNDLLPCPFCGGTATRKEVNYCLSRGVQVHCIRCHSSTPAFYTGYDPVTGEDVPMEQVSARDVRVWNSRRAAV